MTESAHLVHRILHEAQVYPPHAPRVATPEYRAIHHKLVVVENRACIGCGVRNSTLSDPSQNPYGAIQQETHHHVVELALTNAVDLDKFNARIVARMRAIHPNNHVYAKDFTQQQMIDWIDHSPDNLWVLCNECHRGPYGVHSVTFSVWNCRDILRPDYNPPRHDPGASDFVAVPDPPDQTSPGG